PARYTLFPFTTLFRSVSAVLAGDGGVEPPRTDPESAVLPLDESPACLRAYHGVAEPLQLRTRGACVALAADGQPGIPEPRQRARSEEHTSELQSRENL